MPLLHLAFEPAVADSVTLHPVGSVFLISRCRVPVAASVRLAVVRATLLCVTVGVKSIVGLVIVAFVVLFTNRISSEPVGVLNSGYAV